MSTLESKRSNETRVTISAQHEYAVEHIREWWRSFRGNRVDVVIVVAAWVATAALTFWKESYGWSLIVLALPPSILFGVHAVIYLHRLFDVGSLNSVTFFL
jgi:hypothetical protein